MIITGLLDLLRVRQQQCPWLSNGSLANACRLRDIAHRWALKSGSTSDWSASDIEICVIKLMLCYDQQKQHILMTLHHHLKVRQENFGDIV